jgi:HlyD family secretion protein
VLLWVAAAAAVAAGVLVGRMAVTRRQAPLHFQTAAVDRGPIAAKITATGVVSALVTVSVGSQVSGRIEALYADYGSRVSKGEIVAKIEPSLFRAAVAQARANTAAAAAGRSRAGAQSINADRQYVRTKALHAENLASSVDLDASEAALGVARADVDSAEAALLQANAALAQAELNLRYTTIVSPIDGIVISRNVDVGQTVAATLQAPTLFTIAQDLKRMQVDTNVAEADVGRVHRDMGVTFRVDAYPTRVFQGRIRQVRDNAQTIQNVVTYDAVIDVDNSEGLLKPGMTANVTVVYSEEADVLRVPNAALRFRPDHNTLAAMQVTAPATVDPDQRLVWIANAGTAAPKIVRIGISDGTYTEVLEGALRAGDQAIEEIAGDTSKPGP